MNPVTKMTLLLLSLLLLSTNSQVWIREYQYKDLLCEGSVMRTSYVPPVCYNLTTALTGTSANVPRCTAGIPRIYACKGGTPCNGTSNTNCFYMFDPPVGSQCARMDSNNMIGSCTPPVPQPSTYVLYQEFLDADCTKPIWYPQNHTMTSCFSKSESSSTKFTCSGEGVNVTFYNSGTDCSTTPLSVTNYKIGQCTKNVFSPFLYIKYSECGIPLTPRTSRSGALSIHGYISWVVTLLIITHFLL